MSKKTPHRTHPDRWANGTQRPGFSGPALKHGAYAFEARGPAALPADLRISVEEFQAQVIADRGGIEALSAIDAGYIRRLRTLETLERILGGDLATNGVVTPGGDARSVLAWYLQTVLAWDRYAQRIGTERLPKAVLTLPEYFAMLEAAPAVDTVSAAVEHEPEESGE